jgi:uncharacterized integral membrane protein (TIGR00697 family)
MIDIEETLTPFLVLVATFVTCLVTAQVISAKIIAIAVPVLGAITIPGGTLAYAGTFYATDCLSELYGKHVATRVVQVAFVMNFVLLALVYLTITAPAADSSVPPDQFATVLGAAPSIVAGSLIAYLISQHWDVFAFHRVRELTDGEYLWVRNLASTGTSQLVDTVVFTVVAFKLAPLLLPGGVNLPLEALVVTIVGQYVAKLLIAAGDTPFVYATVALVRGGDGDPSPAPA